jgi:hypothetical protein
MGREVHSRAFLQRWSDGPAYVIGGLVDSVAARGFSVPF